MRDWLTVLWMALWMPLHQVSLWLGDARVYFRNPLLLRVDLMLAWAYWWRNPYFMARREGAGTAVPVETLTYGTTPWQTADRLFDRIGAQPGERLLELGAGQGRMAFFAGLQRRLTVDAYELLPTFVRVAETIGRRLGLTTVRFHAANLLSADLSMADIVYLAGTCLDDATLDALQERMAWLKPGARVISLSFPLDVPGLVVIGEEPVPVSWGHSTAFLHHMTGSAATLSPSP